MVKDRSFYRTLLKIGLPAAFQSLISLSLVFIDNIMVGRLDNKVLVSAVAQADIITMFFAFFIKGLTGGASLLISQYWGKKDMKRIKSVFSIILVIGITTAVAVTLIVFFFPKFAMNIVTNDPEVINEGAKYIKILCIMYVFYIISDSLVAMLRCVEIVSVTLYISIASLIISVFFDYALIFGKFGFPALGIQGGAIATVIAKVAEFIIIMIFTFRIQKRIDYKISDLFKIEKFMWKDYARYGVPVILGDLQWGLVNVLRGIIIGRVSIVMMSANSMADTIMQLARVFTVGLGSAACVIIGKSVGEKNYEKTKAYSKTLEILFAIVGAVMCTGLFFSRNLFISLYGMTDADVNKYAGIFIAIGAVTMLGTFYHATCFTGINRGAGDSKFVFKVDMFCGWCVVLPLTALNALVLNSPLPVIFLCTRIDQCFKWIIAWIRLRGNKWIKNVTRE